MAQKNPNIKKANTEQEFDYDQIQELKRCMADPVYFIRTYVKIQHPTRGAIDFDLYPYQEKMIRGYQENRYAVVLASRQVGKALAIDTPIPTPTGWTTMGNIKTGDMVLGGDGKPTTVTFATDVMYDHNCYDVEFSNGEHIIADADHKWAVNDWYRNYSSRVLTTEQMYGHDGNIRPDGKTCRYSVDVTDPLDLPQQDLPVDPYVLGTWLGDGCSSRAEFTVHQDDLSMYDYHQQLYEDFYVRTYEDKEHIKYPRVPHLNKLLHKQNLHNNKHIPQQFLRSSFNQRLHLLQGLMDTDGTIYKKNNVCELTLSNDQLANDAYELICSLGLKPTFSKRTKTGFSTNCITFMAYRDNFDVFKLPRKVELQAQTPYHKRQNSTKRRSIISITPVPSAPVRCITVDNEQHLFLAGKGMIPTHNSETAAAFLLWYAIFNFDKNILIASNKNKNAMEMVHRIKFAYENIPHWLKPGILDDGWNKHSIGFDNGSRIISEATSENSGRGMAISLLYLDEFAFVAPAVQEEFWTSISPTLSTGGSCIITSTPNGDMNIFAHLWRGAQVESNGFYPVRIRWDEPPDRDETFKEQQIQLIGERQWEQEYECEFLSSDALLFDSRVLANRNAAIESIPKPSYVREVKFWDDIKKQGTYLVGVDPATGSGQDYTAIEVFEFPSLTQVAEYRSNTMSPNDMYEVLKNILKYLEKQDTLVYFSIENNGVGEGLISLYEQDEEPPENAEFISEEGANRRGMTTMSRVKMKACVNFKEMWEKEQLHVRSKILFQEMKQYVRHRGSYAAQHGSTDDLISATLIIVRLLEEIASYDQDAFDKLYSGSVDEWDEWGTPLSEYDDNDSPMPISV